MIIDAIISLAYTLFTPLVAVFPNANTQALTLITQSIYNAKASLASFNWIFPIDTLFFCMNITIGIVIAIGLFRLIRWLASILTVNILH